MSDKEKFDGFRLVEENEQKYGKEIRAKYGDEAIDASNAKIQGMSAQQYERNRQLEKEYQDALKFAFEQGDPASPLAQKACELHKQWLCLFWGNYSPEAHKGVTQMYVDDPRFTEYYDKIVPGCATFLRDAVTIYCNE